MIATEAATTNRFPCTSKCSLSKASPITQLARAMPRSTIHYHRDSSHNKQPEFIQYKLNITTSTQARSHTSHRTKSGPSSRHEPTPSTQFTPSYESNTAQEGFPWQRFLSPEGETSFDVRSPRAPSRSHQLIGRRSTEANHAAILQALCPVKSQFCAKVLYRQKFLLPSFSVASLDQDSITSYCCNSLFSIFL